MLREEYVYNLKQNSAVHICSRDVGYNKHKLVRKQKTVLIISNLL